MRKNIVVVKLAILFFAISATAVVMPGADTRNAYKFKKDYEDAFKDRNSKKAALKFKVKGKVVAETESDNKHNANGELCDNLDLKCDEKKNEVAIAALFSPSQPPQNTVAGIGDTVVTTGGDAPVDPPPVDPPPVDPPPVDPPPVDPPPVDPPPVDPPPVDPPPVDPPPVDPPPVDPPPVDPPPVDPPPVDPPGNNSCVGNCGNGKGGGGGNGTGNEGGTGGNGGGNN